LSPAGTAASQWTRPAPPGTPIGLAVALDVTMGCALGRGEVEPEEGEMLHAETASAIATNAGLKRTG